MGLIGYVVLIAIVSMVLSAAIFWVARLVGIEDRRILALFGCGALPIVLLGYAVWRLTSVESPTPAELDLIMAGQLADPGPASFADAMLLGIVPALLYALSSIPVFRLMIGRSSE